jgi:hypothetical protein
VELTDARWRNQQVSEVDATDATYGLSRLAEVKPTYVKNTHGTYVCETGCFFWISTPTEGLGIL